jgi:hypothetical protein
MGKAQTMGWVIIAAVLFIAVLPIGFCTGDKTPTTKIVEASTSILQFRSK